MPLKFTLFLKLEIILREFYSASSIRANDRLLFRPSLKFLDFSYKLLKTPNRTSLKNINP